MSDRPVEDASTYRHNRPASMPSARFEPAIPATKRRQTYALGPAARGVGNESSYNN
jgi:hypothetical protein